ncbi:hypothetical protein D9611_002189 [Ephemerocybe angulata]|uniref:Small ribosomal subunit protein bS18m n=1 Tax=Ephemerocybe angulata TaxID=980116 RepID=A0A8H5C156_9AGAR|nr:hypothetical protein D9611_002189 [Tulosesus angulatus]
MYSRVTHIARQSAPRLSASYATKRPSISSASPAAFAPVLEKPAAAATLKTIIVSTAQSKEEEAAAQGSTQKILPMFPGGAVRPAELSYSVRVHDNRKPRPKRPIVAPSTQKAKGKDVFYQLSLDPLSIATNASILSGYVTEMGQIRPRTSTELTVKSQRKLGKAIRRARMMGVIPLLSKFPSQEERKKSR